MTENIYNSLMSYEWDNINYHYLNRYINFVNSILEKRENKRFEHSERHHICPRALNGTDDADNLIYLSYREHFLAHYMLAKAFVKHKVTYALTKMMDGKIRAKNSRMYEQAKLLVAETVSFNNKGKFAGEKNPFYGKKHPPELMEQIRQKLIGKHHTEESRRKMSEQRKGENHPNWGKHLSEETKRHISEAKKGKKANMSKESNDERVKKILETKNEKYVNAVYMTNEIDTKYVAEKDIEKYIALGYRIGRIECTSDTKNKISEQALKRYKDKSKIPSINTKWMNNGITNKMVKPENINEYLENGFVFGKIKKNN